MGDNGFVPDTDPEAISINKEIVLDSFKAACLVASWARSVNGHSTDNGGGGIDDSELDEDLAQWTILEAISRSDVSTYDQLTPSPVKVIVSWRPRFARKLLLVITGLYAAIALAALAFSLANI